MTSETDAEFVERMSELPFWISIRRDTEWFVRLIALARRGAAAAARIERLEAENMRLRQHIANMANNINVAGSPYDNAMTALEDLMRSIKSESRAALEDKP